MWANDKVRVHYWVPINDPEYEAEYEHSLGGPKEEAVHKLNEVFFKRTSDFKASIECDFDEDLYGLRNFYVLFHTREGKDQSLYNNWNFSTPLIWDSIDGGFWYSQNTTILVFVATYTVGKE